MFSTDMTTTTKRNGKFLLKVECLEGNPDTDREEEGRWSAVRQRTKLIL